MTRMTKRLVDIDDDLLAEASEILGAETMKETVNRALEEAIGIALRRRHVDRLVKMQGLDLDEPEVLNRAWRIGPRTS